MTDGGGGANIFRQVQLLLEKYMVSKRNALTERLKSVVDGVSYIMFDVQYAIIDWKPARRRWMLIHRHVW